MPIEAIVYSFTCSINSHLFNTYYVPGTVPGSIIQGNTKTDLNLIVKKGAKIILIKESLKYITTN